MRSSRCLPACLPACLQLHQLVVCIKGHCSQPLTHFAPPKRFTHCNDRVFRGARVADGRTACSSISAAPQFPLHVCEVYATCVSGDVRRCAAKLVRRTRSRRCEEPTLIFPLESISLSSLSSFQFADLVQISKIIIVSTGFSRREGDACSGAHTNSTPL